MKYLNKIKGLVFFALGILLFLSCAGKNGNHNHEIRVGVIGPLKTSNGVSIWNSFVLAAEEINAQNGILNKKIVLYPLDDDNNVITGVKVLSQEITSKNLDIIVGGLASGIVMRQMEIMADKKILWLGTGGSHAKIIKLIEENYDRYKYYFRIGTADASQQGIGLANFIKNHIQPKFSLKKYAALVLDLEWGRATFGALRKMLDEAGFELKYEKYFSSHITDFSNFLINAQRSGADFIVNLTLSEEGNLLIKQYYDLKPNIPMFGINALGTRKEWWHETNGKCVYSGFLVLGGAPVAITPKTLTFFNHYQKRFKISPGFLSWPAYNALFILKQAATQANSIETEALIPELENLEFTGNVHYKFTPNHDLTYGTINSKKYLYPIYFQWKKDGKLYPVWPKEVAEKDFELPSWIQTTRKQEKK